jgi:hypothetical protein
VEPRASPVPAIELARGWTIHLVLLDAGQGWPALAE